MNTEEPVRSRVSGSVSLSSRNFYLGEYAFLSPLSIHVYSSLLSLSQRTHSSLLSLNVRIRLSSLSEYVFVSSLSLRTYSSLVSLSQRTYVSGTVVNRGGTRPRTRLLANIWYAP